MSKMKVNRDIMKQVVDAFSDAYFTVSENPEESQKFLDEADKLFRNEVRRCRKVRASKKVLNEIQRQEDIKYLMENSL